MNDDANCTDGARWWRSVGSGKPRVQQEKGLVSDGWDSSARTATIVDHRIDKEQSINK